MLAGNVVCDGKAKPHARARILIARFVHTIEGAENLLSPFLGDSRTFVVEKDLNFSAGTKNCYMTALAVAASVLDEV